MKYCSKKQLHFSCGLLGTDSRRAFAFQRRDASSQKPSILSISFFPILVNFWKSSIPENSYLSFCLLVELQLGEVTLLAWPPTSYSTCLFFVFWNTDDSLCHKGQLKIILFSLTGWFLFLYLSAFNEGLFPILICQYQFFVISLLTSSVMFTRGPDFAL